jgi:uncharacterized membrane protein (DUF4010 family)
MNQDFLVTSFGQFGLAIAIGFLIGLEREMGGNEPVTPGIRDFVLFALLGATASFLSTIYQSDWLLMVIFSGFLIMIALQYWSSSGEDQGITTELAALMTFLIGVLILKDQATVAVALSIVTLGVLFQKHAISRFRDQVKAHELHAVIKFLIISFIILPVLPRQSLDTYMTYDVGRVVAFDLAAASVEVEVKPGLHLKAGDELRLFGPRGRERGLLQVEGVDGRSVTGNYRGDSADLVTAGMVVRQRFGIGWLETALSAIKPYKLWLIVVLVSLVSFIGYVLIKVVGTAAGVGLTGLIGGLVSSTVTTLSFARRSKESPDLSPYFAGAVVLASSVMFPRLLLEIAVVDQVLMKGMALPILIMGTVGGILAVFEFRRSKRHSSEAGAPEMQFDNPFSLKSAISFALVFALVLIITRVATTYLGSSWLPLVAFVSGLTDADAIAFSLSSAHQAGLISTSWASFNLVLGAIANTLMKLFLVYTLGHRKLFYLVARTFILISIAGIVTAFLYYDLSTALNAPTLAVG